MCTSRTRKSLKCSIEAVTPRYCCTCKRSTLTSHGLNYVYPLWQSIRNRKCPLRRSTSLQVRPSFVNDIFRLRDQLLRGRRGRGKRPLTVLCWRWNDGSIRGRRLRHLHGVHGCQHQHHNQQVHLMRVVGRWIRLPMGCSQ